MNTVHWTAFFEKYQHFILKNSCSRLEAQEKISSRLEAQDWKKVLLVLVSTVETGFSLSTNLMSYLQLKESTSSSCLNGCKRLLAEHQFNALFAAVTCLWLSGSNSSNVSQQAFNPAFNIQINFQICDTYLKQFKPNIELWPYWPRRIIFKSFKFSVV